MTTTIDRFFDITGRESHIGAEVRGGLATFFTMAYIVALNPIILGGKDVDKRFLTGTTPDSAKIAAATALVAAVLTLLMGVWGRVPIALAAGLGVNALVAFQLAPQMSWPAAMGIVVLEGLVITVLVLLGFRSAVFDAIPTELKHAITVGIGLFIAFIGFVDAGFVHVPPGQGTPVTLGPNGTLLGWPVVVFAFGLLLTAVLVARKVRGAILVGIVVTTVFGAIVNAAVDIPAKAWGLNVPKWPSKVFAVPNFDLLGHFSLGGGVANVGTVSVIVFVFTLVLSDFFDTMGTVVGVSAEAGLLDDDGNVPRADQILLVDSLAAAAGGAAATSSATCYIESASGVGEWARTGLANVVTAALFGVALFVTPLVKVIPYQAAAPALVVVGFLMMSQVRHIDWNDFDVAIPAFLTIVLMPFTYSITNGIGAGFVAYAVLKLAGGKAREVNWLLWIIVAFFVVYFALAPVESWLGVS